MLEMLVALDFVQRHMKRKFEPDGLVSPMRVARPAERDTEGTIASAPQARPQRRLRTLALRRGAA